MPSDNVSRAQKAALKLRIVMLLEAARLSGMNPLPAEILHNLAYFSNLLAPLWQLKPLDGKVLRLKRGPYYPDLQRQIDHLVATGLVTLSNLRYEQLPDSGHWQVLADYRLDTSRAEPVLHCISSWEKEQSEFSFIRELMLSISSLSDLQLKAVEIDDATYSSNVIGYGNVIDFGEWKNDNPSVDAAEYFQKIMPGNIYLSRSNKLNFFISHLAYRVDQRRLA